ncbi:thermonuclease family protein [Bacillus sonorensis]|uniref:thermonuclease family protein n=1 Tax=Bacillus sonorensis TaxID=119858 RepID=UPI001F438CA0|nr:thermonuclease family protein [Bacillus sonorensis]MCF7617577.1 thermonuclease family protein [Bacillus sonorensis]MCY8034981.1 thermonuclease family protein [Bacillus sonorensis]MCY8561203.1 thermonuclease family protein [Bacillus sonorensis]
MKKCVLAIAALILSVSLAACNSSAVSSKKTEDGRHSDRVAVTLIRAVDGDTIKVKYKGKEKTVRYLLIDTPETKKPNSCVQPYGKDASSENKKLVSSGKLELEFDKGDRTDKYGRLLAYVYADGQSVQEQLLKEGLARVAYVYPPNTKYLDQYQKDEKAAKKKQIAIWTKSGYVTDKGFNGCAAGKSKTAQTSISAPKSALSKDAAASGAHSKDAAPSSDAKETFTNCTELRKKYPNGVPKSHPAYQAKMDRDHDNYACER